MGGLTHSWNLAWSYFMNHTEYDFLIICNNDLLVPDGTVRKLVQGLRTGWAWLLPVVAERGTGYDLHRLKDYYPSVAPEGRMHWTNGPLNYTSVQRILDRTSPHEGGQVLQHARNYRMNGYMMAFRKDLMAPLEWDHHHH